MSPEEHRKWLEDLVARHARELGEHVDAVQIFVSMDGSDVEEKTTCTYRTGRGSILARIQQAREWVMTQDEWAREAARRSAQTDDPDIQERDNESGE